MRWFRLAALAMMAVYSLALLAIELRTSQDHVRHYFTDIEGPVRLFAINTTVSTFLLWAGALIFCVVLLVIHGAHPTRPPPGEPGQERERWFCMTQIAIFGYLGADDRFLLHEQLSDVVPLHDTLILVLVGVMEAAALALLGDLRHRSARARLYIALAAFLFLAMAAIDAFLPWELALRLSFEDLAKVWGTLFIFLFSWEVLEAHVRELKEAAAR